MLTNAAVESKVIMAMSEMTLTYRLYIDIFKIAYWTYFLCIT